MKKNWRVTFWNGEYTESAASEEPTEEGAILFLLDQRGPMNGAFYYWEENGVRVPLGWGRDLRTEYSVPSNDFGRIAS